MRVSNPRHFNDPYDCRVALDTESVDSAAELAAVRAVIRETHERADDRDFARQMDEEWDRIVATASGASLLARRIGELMTREALRHRILCFARNPLAPLLWAHYGDAHRGICIEVDASSAPFSQALEVDYQPAYPKLDFAAGSPDAFVRIALLTKADCWKYEEEFRLIASESSSTFLRCKGDLIDLPPGAVTRIIFGHKALPSDVETARSLIHRHDAGVGLSWLVRVRSSYELAFVHLDISKPVSEQLRRHGHPADS
jgi:hypothetical protein